MCDGAHLTAREIDVLVRTAAGMRASQIAACLHISRRTVEYHLARMLRLIGAENAVQAVSWCYAVGVLVPLTWPPQWSGQFCLTRQPISTQDLAAGSGIELSSSHSEVRSGFSSTR